MAHSQALNAQRAPAFSFAPGELTIITDKDDPLYDRRVLSKPVTREQVLDYATRGIHTAIKVRRRGDLAVVVAGKQRTKGAFVANAIGAGVKYKGELAPVIAAIDQFEQDPDFVKRVTLLMRGKPLRLTATAANAGDDGHARGIMFSENVHRVNDDLAERIADAQMSHEQHGDPPEKLATEFGVTVQTMKRWLAKDLNKAVEPKVRSTKRRPGAKKTGAVVAFIVQNADRLPVGLATLARWFDGDADDASLEIMLPGARAAMAKKE